ncbi:hypothetical protein C7212DRAFT_364756 [Tuber magnatum]|uniref:Uncharacterized protein n=1 Tax=Tuber magnatum TaxID=42249 RepID=A0A317SNJ6_9PEZI|nr:hypothetical protein C7212DRAFT_364756 [Tuber magnatum]
MLSITGGQGSLPPPAEAERAKKGDATTCTGSVLSGGTFDNAILPCGVSNEHSQSKSPSPAVTPLQKFQTQLDKARFEKEIATIQARAQNSPLAKLPKLRLATQTPTSTPNSAESRQKRRKRKEVALPPLDGHAPREEESVMESLGTICYCVVGLYACLLEMFGAWMVFVFLDPVLAMVVCVILWAVVEALEAARHWLMEGVGG